MSPSLEDKRWSVSSTPLFGYMGREYMGRGYMGAWDSRGTRDRVEKTRVALVPAAASLTMFPLVIFST